MADPYISIAVTDGATLDKYFRYMKYKYTWNRDPIGFIINNASTDPKIQIIDRNETAFDPDPDFFYNHELFQWPKCILSEAGVEIDGVDYIGSDLDVNGTSGDVMTYIPNGQYSYKWEPDANVQIYKYAPYDSNHRGFDFFPHCFSGGGTKHDHFFIGTYKAGLKDDAGTLKFNSCSGVQPWTGGQMRSVPFSAGATEFTVGETITGTTSTATGTVVSWHKTSGDWSAGTAMGVVYIRNYGVYVPTATAFSNGETLTRASGSATTSGISGSINLTLDNALTYANNKGAGWTISDVYSTAWIQGLLYAMAETRDTQTAFGKGVSECRVGVGYAGLLNGDDNINLNINGQGNGMGDGVNGQTPICVNNIYDLWGGGLEFISGINTYANGSYRLTNPDGTKPIAATLPDGSYITGITAIPLTNGYVSSVQKDKMGAILWIPLTAGDTGSGSIAKFCDQWSYSTNDPAIVISGGTWAAWGGTGIGLRAALPTTRSSRSVGARLKYIPQS